MENPVGNSNISSHVDDACRIIHRYPAEMSHNLTSTWAENSNPLRLLFPLGTVTCHSVFYLFIFVFFLLCSGSQIIGSSHMERPLALTSFFLTIRAVYYLLFLIQHASSTRACFRFPPRAFYPRLSEYCLVSEDHTASSVTPPTFGSTPRAHRNTEIPNSG